MNSITVEQRTERTARQQMVDLLTSATDEKARQMLEMLIALHDGASCPEKTADLRG